MKAELRRCPTVKVDNGEQARITATSLGRLDIVGNGEQVIRRGRPERPRVHQLAAPAPGSRMVGPLVPTLVPRFLVPRGSAPDVEAARWRLGLRRHDRPALAARITGAEWHVVAMPGDGRIDGSPGRRIYPPDSLTEHSYLRYVLIVNTFVP